MNMMPNATTIISLLVSFTITVFSIRLLTPLAIRLGLVDTPGGRKKHAGTIPLIGGICMFLGFAFALLALNISLENYRSLIAGSALLIFLGVLDDFHELTARLRLIGQVIAACLMTIWGQNFLHDFGNLIFIGNIHLGIFGIPITVFAVVGIINAVNMTDGIDGLAGSLILCQLIILALLSYLDHSINDFQIIMLLIAVIVGFLLFNLPFYKKNLLQVFMGDAGSMFLGFVLAWFLVSLSQGIHSAARPVTMLWIMAIPLFDTTRLLIKRSRNKQSPFKPGRDHIHHILEDMSFHPSSILLIVCGSSLCFGLVGILGGHFEISASIMFVSFVLFFMAYFFILNSLENYRSKIQMIGDVLQRNLR